MLFFWGGGVLRSFHSFILISNVTQEKAAGAEMLVAIGGFPSLGEEKKRPGGGGQHFFLILRWATIFVCWG